MTYCAYITGNDVGTSAIYYARTILGAKRLAMQKFGDGFLHHKICVGAVDDSGRIIPIASRRIADKKWSNA